MRVVGAWWEPAQAVLRARFPGVELRPDVRELRDLPRGLDPLSAGFPCTDLSQAGRTAGIAGAQSGLVSHVFEALRLTAVSEKRLPWLMIENVPNMLTLDKGKAMSYLVREIEALGYRWAYRVVDSRFTGVPQRRRRVILLASASEDPRRALFADDAGAPEDRLFVTPSVEDAEAMQSFDRGWTDVLTTGRRNGPRWKLVGNAVTTRVAEWVSRRISEPGDPVAAMDGPQVGDRWPTAAWGDSGTAHAVSVSEFPTIAPYEHLSSVVDLSAASPLSARAINGFQSRLLQGNLGRYEGFREDVARYREVMSPQRNGAVLPA